ncbi:MAG: hypothetical protein WCC84_12380 [Candidatus Cybelea sp.]
MTSNKNIVMVVVLLTGLGLIYITGLHDPKQYLYMAVVSGGAYGGIYAWLRLVKKYPVSPGFLAVWVTFLAVPFTFYGLETR